MCESCRNAVRGSMPFILAAAAMSFRAAVEARADTDNPPNFDAVDDTTGLLTHMADLGRLAYESGQNPSPDSTLAVQARLGAMSTEAVRKTATLAWYGGELMQSIAGICAASLEHRATSGTGDAEAATFLFDEVGSLIRKFGERIEREYDTKQPKMVAIDLSEMLGRSRGPKTPPPAPEFMH
jgi:hypothetical protein